jgi:hypothetical protein
LGGRGGAGKGAGSGGVCEEQREEDGVVEDKFVLVAISFMPVLKLLALLVQKYEYSRETRF